jgi:glycosyltransferase involved in cell wall biosynthesis
MQRPLNIIFAGGFSYPKGYAGTQLVQTAINYFHCHGHSVRIFSWGNLSGIASERGRNEGVPFSVSPFRGAGALKAIMVGLIVLIRSRSQSGRHVLIVYGLPEPKNLHLIVAARLFGFKVVHWVVEDYEAYDLSNAESGVTGGRIAVRRFFSRFLKFFADGVIVLSTWLERKYVNQGMQTALVPISTGRLAINPGQPENIRRNTVVYAGTFGQKDGVEDLIEAFKQVGEKIPAARLELVGSGIRQRELKEKYADMEGVVFLGYLNDEQYEETLATAHVLCMTRVNTPYANAGFPYKIGDYLAMGRPVMATRVGDIDRYLTDGESVRLADSGDKKMMADTLNDLLSHSSKADRIGMAGRKVCERFFNPEINGRLIEDFINGL